MAISSTKSRGNMRLALALSLIVPRAGWAVPVVSPGSPDSKGGEALSAKVEPKSTAGTFGLSYFTFFDGPALAGNFGVTPNWLGRPLDDGLSFFNLVSLKYRVSETLAIDYQLRVQVLVNNGTGSAGFEQVRWHSPRIGISGKLASGENWTLSGAVNTDFPYLFPAPFGGGFVAEKRTVLFNPGLFANFSYKVPGSKWSFFTLITPRFFVYEDRDAAEPQLTQGGLSPGLKPELALQFSPSLTYELTEKVGLRMGTVIDYRKLVLSSWNPFSASFRTADVNSEAWRLWATPLQVGVNLALSKALNIYTFVNTYPIAAQRERRDGSRASFAETASVGMWINGTLF